MWIPLHIKFNTIQLAIFLYVYSLIINSSLSIRTKNSLNGYFSFLTNHSHYRNNRTGISVNLFSTRKDSTHKDKYLITSPLFYLNGEPHLGHVYTLVAADALKRYLFLRGYDAKLLVGTDEHGSKIKSASKKLGYSPKDYVLSMRKRFTDVYSCYDIVPDIVVHTSESEHKIRVKNTFDTLLKSGDIYRGLHKGYFSPKEDTYYTKSKLVNGKSPLGFEVEFVEEPAYFFRLNKWKDRLKEFFSKNQDSILPEHRLNEIKNTLDSDLNDVAITRSSCDWGTEVAEGETIYVWFDALLGYLNHLKQRGGGYSTDNSKIIHVLGKDILSFHTIFWPSMLMALGLELPCKFIAHGWLLSKGDKISKSLNNSIPALPPPQNSDVCRLALMNLGDFRYDFEFNPSIFESSLGIIKNKFANTCHRITSVLNLNKVETINPPFYELRDLKNDDSIYSIFTKFSTYPKCLDDHVRSFRLDRYIQVLIEMSYEINKFLEEKQFWLIDSLSGQFVSTAWTACSLLFYLGLYLMPITPKLSNDIISRLRPRVSGETASNPTFECLDNVIQYSYNPVHLNQLT